MYEHSDISTTRLPRRSGGGGSGRRSVRPVAFNRRFGSLVVSKLDDGDVFGVERRVNDWIRTGTWCSCSPPAGPLLPPAAFCSLATLANIGPDACLPGTRDPHPGQNGFSVMKRTLAVLVIVVAVGCSTGSKSPPNVSAELLALSDLPAGWIVDTATPVVAAPACLQPLAGQPGTTASAQARFAGSAARIPVLHEDVAYFPDGGAAALSAFDALISSCSDIRITYAGRVLRGTITQMSFPKLGDQSEAFQLLLSYRGVIVGLDEITARKNNTVMSMSYEAIGTPDVTQVQQIASTAIGKL